MKTWYRKLSIEHLWALTVLVGIFVFVNTHPIRPHDFWWHLAAGRELALTGRIPLVDTASQMMTGAPYLAYQTYWLMEWTLYQVYRLGGAPFIVLFQTLIITGAYGLILWLAQQRTGSWRTAAFAGLFSASLGMNDWNVRPQTVTFLLGALFLSTIHVYQHHPRRRLLAIFPVGMLIWVNSHGSFPLGLLLIGLWCVDETWNGFMTRRWKSLFGPATAFCTAALACLLNPRGPGVINYITAMTTDPVVQNLVPEWAPPTFDTLMGQLFFGGLLLSAAILALSPRRPAPSQLLTFLVFGALGLRTSRGVIWFGLTMAPVLADHLHRLFDALRKRTFAAPKSSVSGPRSSVTAPQRALNAALALLLLAGAAFSLPWFKGLWPLPPEKAGLIAAETPIAATEFLLRERPPGPLFHAMSFGSYLIWAAQPEYPVFVDPRIELYLADLWLDYIRISAAAPGWEARLEQYGVRTLMLSPQEQPGLVRAARESGRWKILYEDQASTIFVRESN